MAVAPGRPPEILVGNPPPKSTHPSPSGATKCCQRCTRSTRRYRAFPVCLLRLALNSYCLPPLLLLLCYNFSSARDCRGPCRIDVAWFYVLLSMFDKIQKWYFVFIQRLNNISVLEGVVTSNSNSAYNRPAFQFPKFSTGENLQFCFQGGWIWTHAHNTELDIILIVLTIVRKAWSSPSTGFVFVPICLTYLLRWKEGEFRTMQSKPTIPTGST